MVKLEYIIDAFQIKRHLDFVDFYFSNVFKFPQWKNIPFDITENSIKLKVEKKKLWVLIVKS